MPTRSEEIHAELTKILAPYTQVEDRRRLRGVEVRFWLTEAGEAALRDG